MSRSITFSCSSFSFWPDAIATTMWYHTVNEKLCLCHGCGWFSVRFIFSVWCFSISDWSCILSAEQLFRGEVLLLESTVPVAMAMQLRRDKMCLEVCNELPPFRHWWIHPVSWFLFDHSVLLLPTHVAQFHFVTKDTGTHSWNLSGSRFVQKLWAEQRLQMKMLVVPNLMNKICSLIQLWVALV